MSASVFPARAGMSPNQRNECAEENRVPRASGDEPARLSEKDAQRRCSPRERG